MGDQGQGEGQDGNTANPPQRNFFEANIVKLTAIATAIVALGSQLNSCSDQRIKRFEAFRNAVAAEEKYWQDRFKEYPDVAVEKDLDKRNAQLVMLDAESTHRVPDFTEYQFAVFDDAGAIKDAQSGLNNWRLTFQQAVHNLAADKKTDPKLATNLQSASAFDGEQNNIASRPTDSGPSTTPAAAVTTASVAVNPASQTLSPGLSNGWDIDIFWCQGNGSDAANYAVALRAAKRLAVLATLKRAIPGDILLGQIRLRPLPLLRQGAGYPVAGSNNVIRAEATPDEQKAAAAVLALLNAPVPGSAGLGFAPGVNVTPTSWYLSGFVCGPANADGVPAAGPVPVVTR